MHPWLNRLRNLGRPSPPRLSAIFISPAAGKSMIPIESVFALQGQGLEGDRYSLQRGYWKVTEACEVTLISEHDLRHALRRGISNQELRAGIHRRNLVISGLRTEDLRNRDFYIGEQAVFRYHRPRPPCGYLDQVERPGLARSLGKHSGVCIQVIREGEIRIGDPLRPV